jgi:hypothetical protein
MVIKKFLAVLLVFICLSSFGLAIEDTIDPTSCTDGDLSTCTAGEVTGLASNNTNLGLTVDKGQTGVADTYTDFAGGGSDTINSVVLHFRHGGTGDTDGSWTISFRDETGGTTYCTASVAHVTTSDVYTDVTPSGCSWTVSRVNDLEVAFASGDAGKPGLAYVLFANITVDYTEANKVPSFDNDLAVNTTPVVLGEHLKFNVSATDPEGDNYYLTVCKTDSINDGTPGTCAANQKICASGSTASGAQASCTNITTEAGSFTAYGFLCDVGSSTCNTTSTSVGYEVTSPQGTMIITTVDPAESPWNVSLNQGIDANYTVTCKGGDCGSVSAFLRYNLSGTLVDTLVNKTNGEVPLSIINSRNGSFGGDDVFHDDADTGTPSDYGWGGASLTYASDQALDGSNSIKEDSNNVGGSTSLNMSGMSFPIQITYSFYDSQGSAQANRRWLGSFDTADGPHDFRGTFYSYSGTSTEYQFIHPNASGGINPLGVSHSIGWHKVKVLYPNESGVKVWLDDSLVYEEGAYLIDGPRGDTRNMNLSLKSQASTVPVWIDNVTITDNIGGIGNQSTIRFSLAEDESADLSWKVNFTGASGSSYKLQLWLNGSNVVSSNDSTVVVQNVTEGVGDPDTNLSIWDGNGWLRYDLEEIQFRCTPTQSQCEPTNQDVGSSQSIYRVCNNGTGSASQVLVNISQTFTGLTLKCDDDYTYVGATTITTSDQDIHGSLGAGACIPLSCWADYSSPTSGGAFTIGVRAE